MPLLRAMATEQLAYRLISVSGIRLTAKQKDEAIERLANAFQREWIKERQLLVHIVGPQEEE